MTKDSIEKVKEAEALSAKIRTDAATEARALAAAAQEKGKALYDEAEAKAEQEKKARLAKAEKEAKALLDEKKREAGEKAEKLKAGADVRMEDAVRVIVQGVNSIVGK